MVIFKPDGSHGMYSWLHVLIALSCAAAAWYSLRRATSWRAAAQQGAG
jgi:alpha-1,6-mannosyltransferase